MKLGFHYNFHGLFSVSSNIPYFEGLLHSFKSQSSAPISLSFFLEDKLNLSTRNKPNVNLMFYYDENDDSIEFSYPWIAPVHAKLVFKPDGLSYAFSCNKNYLRLSKLVAEGWDLIDIFRSVLQLSLLRTGRCMLHGAVVRFGQEGLLIPSFGNTGKTLTSWMLANRGAEFITDEFAILDSSNDCLSFPMNSIVSEVLVREMGIRLTRKQKMALVYRDAKSKILSTRLASGGLALNPGRILRVADRVTISRIFFIQNGIDECRSLEAEHAMALFRAVQDYELNWRSNPWIIARSFFRPDLNVQDGTTREEAMIRFLISKVGGAYLVSSSSGHHYLSIERALQSTVIEPSQSVAV